MRKRGIFAFFAILIFLFSACAKGASGGIAYPGEEHTHVYGLWYDVTAVTCRAAGEQIRYCKVCHAEETQVMPVATDVAARAHTFADTVVPPTGTEWGYTTRVCTACGYTVEHTDPVPPLYALITNGASEELPDGVTALLLADTGTRVALRAANVNAAVNAEPARRLAVALAVYAELARAGTTHTGAETVTFTEAMLSGLSAAVPKAGFTAGTTVSLENLVNAYVTTGGVDAAVGIFTLFGENESAFLSRVNDCVVSFGVGSEVSFYSLSGTGEIAVADLYGTAVLLARALAVPALLPALADTVPSYRSICEQKPLYLYDVAGSGVWLTALPREEEAPILLAMGAGSVGTSLLEYLLLGY